jgi:hypothetical protein
VLGLLRLNVADRIGVAKEIVTIHLITFFLITTTGTFFPIRFNTQVSSLAYVVSWPFSLFALTSLLVEYDIGIGGTNEHGFV